MVPGDGTEDDSLRTATQRDRKVISVTRCCRLIVNHWWLVLGHLAVVQFNQAEGVRSRAGERAVCRVTGSLRWLDPICRWSSARTVHNGKSDDWLGIGLPLSIVCLVVSVAHYLQAARLAVPRARAGNGINSPFRDFGHPPACGQLCPVNGCHRDFWRRASRMGGGKRALRRLGTG